MSRVPLKKSNQKHICVLGSGAWGSVIARIIARNVLYHSCFYPRVIMWVFEELLDGKKLSEIINTEHENVKYAPGYKFTKNLVAIPDLIEAVKNIDIIVFVFPHQYLENICKSLYGKVKKNAVGISLIKGFQTRVGGGINLISHVISRRLEIQCHVLMGANIASEIAAEKKKYSATLGCKNLSRGRFLKRMFDTEFFKIVVVDDEDTVEVCGALKNIVATGAGFADGLDMNNRYKEVLFRLGLIEIVQFVDIFYPGGKLSTFFESCGIDDMITTSLAGRNRMCAEAFIRTGKPWAELEKEMLHGQKLQGPATAEEVNVMLKKENMSEKFPLFTIIEEIAFGRRPPAALLECLDENFHKKTYIPKTIRV